MTASDDRDARRTIVLADDNEDFRSYLADILRERGFDVIEASNGPELLERLEIDSRADDCLDVFDVLVTDVRMPGITGTSVLEGLAALGAAGRVVVMSAFADDETVEAATRLGAAAVLAKPFGIDALISAVEKAILI